MSRPPFLYGPRDTGPVDLPPWPDLVIAGMGLLLSAIALYVGLKYEWIDNVFVRGPCGFLVIIGLMFGICMIGDGYDKARLEAARAAAEAEDDD